MSWGWALRGLLVGLAVAGLNHWMSLTVVQRTNRKDPFVSIGAIMGSYAIRLFTAGAVLFYFRAHTVALLISLGALTLPEQVFLAYRILREERREGEK